MSDTKKVRALNTVRSNGKRLERGKTYELPNREADFLCTQGRAEEAAIKKAKKKGPMTTKSAGATVA